MEFLECNKFPLCYYLALPPPKFTREKKREVNIDLDRKPANSKNIKIFWSRLEIYRETSKTLKHHQFEPI